MWRIARGIDDSPVKPGTYAHQQQGIGHQMTLPRDYDSWEDIKVVLLELAELVSRRSRDKSLMGDVVSVGCRGQDYDRPTGFSRQMKVNEPTNITDEVYDAAAALFLRHWDGLPIRRISVSLTGLVPDSEVRLPGLMTANVKENWNVPRMISSAGTEIPPLCGHPPSARPRKPMSVLIKLEVIINE